MKRVQSKRGFTLIEIMVAMALLAVILAAGMGAFLSTNASANKSYTIANMQETSRLALDALAADIRIAGLGASNGTVGVAPGGNYAMRIPTIYGSTKTITDPNGNDLTVSSIFIIGADPATVGISATGDGVEGVVTDNTRAAVVCNKGDSSTVDCTAQAVGSDGIDHRILVPNGLAFLPVLLHDHQRASIILPTTVDGFSSTTAPTPPVAQNIVFDGQGGVQPSPNPAAPFGFAQGFQVSRLRVVHWYLKQVNGGLPRLFRSRPTLTKSANPTTGCAVPFTDEDTDITNGTANGVAGVEMGVGPIESFQIRYVLDLADLNDPTQYTMKSSIDPCTTSMQTMRQLREIRVQMVAIAPTQLKDGNGTLVKQFNTPAFEGSGANTTKDAYPRRSYTTRVAPRNFVPYRL